MEDKDWRFHSRRGETFKDFIEDWSEITDVDERCKILKSYEEVLCFFPHGYKSQYKTGEHVKNELIGCVVVKVLQEDWC